jgi:hypothetical protein
MSAYELDDIKKAAEKKYGSTNIKIGGGVEVVLLNPLKLSKATRKKLSQVQENLDEGADEVDALVEALKLIVATPAMVDKLLDAVGDDAATLAEIFSIYQENSQPGEA